MPIQSYPADDEALMSATARRLLPLVAEIPIGECFYVSDAAEATGETMLATDRALREIRSRRGIVLADGGEIWRRCHGPGEAPEPPRPLGVLP
ncbi:MAG: hypothetical protein F4Y94_04130 [Chloroflexi bacterium]|nr:hypothetical protein [Chloroflexota bacterium]